MITGLRNYGIKLRIKNDGEFVQIREKQLFGLSSANRVRATVSGTEKGVLRGHSI